MTSKTLYIAIDSQASIIISGDPDLKKIQRYEGIEIVSPSIFFERFSQLA